MHYCFVLKPHECLIGKEKIVQKTQKNKEWVFSDWRDIGMLYTLSKKIVAKCIIFLIHKLSE